MFRGFFGDCDRRGLVPIGLLAASSFLMWLPAVRTPFWGDDYVFLVGARESNVSGKPWWFDFWPDSPPLFWRPLSQEIYWRWIEYSLDADPYVAHVVNFLLLIAASVSVMIFSFRLGVSCSWPQPGKISVLAGVIYGSLSIHFLPVHWVAAANSSILVIFSALALASWVGAADAVSYKRIFILAAVPMLLAGALLSKESAVLLPILMVLISSFTGSLRIRSGEFVALVMCVVVVFVWLLLRSMISGDFDESYKFTIGGNVFRNLASFAAWVLNVPREALRMVVEDGSVVGIAWLSFTSVPMLIVWLISFRCGYYFFNKKQWLMVPLFGIFAYAPYFFFAWNTYAYYAAVSLIFPIIVMARCLIGSGRLFFATMLIALSSWVGVAGTRVLDHPGLIGRANWAETILKELEHQRIDVPVWVYVEDEQRFYALGSAGISWRTGVKLESIYLTEQCPEDAANCLVLEKNGNWYWRN